MPQLSICNIKIHIEVPLLLVFFSFMLTDSVYTNLVIYRTCYTILNYNESDCALLGTDSNDSRISDLEKLVEPHAAVINMVRGVTEQCVCVVICLFIGPWTDRFGRRPILYLPTIGYTLAYTTLSILAYYPNINPWYFMISTIPVMLTGGGPVFLTVVLSYITDVTSEENRGLRMGVFEAVLAAGIFLGSLLSSYVFSATGYSGTFAISAGCSLLSVLFTVFFIPESLTNRETENKFKGFFQISNMVSMLKVTVKPRENHKRAILFSCILMLAISIFAIYGDGALTFLYLRTKFNWTLRQFTLYSCANSVLWIFGTIFGVYTLNKVLKIPETVLVLVGFISTVNGVLIQGLATTGWHIFAVGGVRCLGGVVSPMIRSLVSKLLPEDEVGKIFSVIITFESLFGLMASPLYTAIYTATINTEPATFNFVTAGLYSVNILITLLVIYLQKSKSDYSRLANGHSDDNSSAINGIPTQLLVN